MYRSVADSLIPCPTGSGRGTAADSLGPCPTGSSGGTATGPSPGRRVISISGCGENLSALTLDG